MIERKFVAEKMKDFLVRTYMSKNLGSGKYSSISIKKTPLGEKVVIYTAKPGLIVGKKGETIKGLTRALKSKFKMENPQIEVCELDNPDLDAQTMAETIVNVLERFGPKRFKSTGYRTLQRIMDSGAMGAEINISGRGLPGSRAKSWRFYAGYLKKSGDVSVSQVLYGNSVANLKSGSVGIKVRILPPNVQLPDKIILKDLSKVTIKVEEITKEETETKEKVKKKTVKKAVKKKTVKKKVKKDENKE
ncbi:MAG: 30S ribosomal protein S3 [archaeon]